MSELVDRVALACAAELDAISAEGGRYAREDAEDMILLAIRAVLDAAIAAVEPTCTAGVADHLGQAWLAGRRDAGAILWHMLAALDG